MANNPIKLLSLKLLSLHSIKSGMKMEIILKDLLLMIPIKDGNKELLLNKKQQVLHLQLLWK